MKFAEFADEARQLVAFAFAQAHYPEVPVKISSPANPLHDDLPYSVALRLAKSSGEKTRGGGEKTRRYAG